MKKVLVVIPTFNEAKNIKKLVRGIFSLPLPTNVLIVDDNSPDGTGEVAESMKKKFSKKLFVLHRKGKLGLGSAYKTGIAWVLENTRADLIVGMDADMSHDPNEIPNLVKKSEEGYDVVIGSRYVLGGGSNQTVVKKLISKTANRIINSILGLGLHDATASFRCYKRAVLEKIPLGKIEGKWFAFLPQMLYYCKQRGFSIAEIPIFYVDRKLGKSKRSASQLVGSLLTILKLRLRRDV